MSTYKKFNITKPKKYTDNQGNEKTQWQNIGIITEFYKADGSTSRILEIPAIGLEANIFPFKDDNIPSAPTNTTQAPNTPQTPTPQATEQTDGKVVMDDGTEIPF